MKMVSLLSGYDESPDQYASDVRERQAAAKQAVYLLHSTRYEVIVPSI